MRTIMLDVPRDARSNAILECYFGYLYPDSVLSAACTQVCVCVCVPFLCVYFFFFCCVDTIVIVAQTFLLLEFTFMARGCDKADFQDLTLYYTLPPSSLTEVDYSVIGTVLLRPLPGINIQVC